jgi:hypothetical protein
MTETQRAVNDIVRTQMDRLKANVKALNYATDMPEEVQGCLAITLYDPDNDGHKVTLYQRSLLWLFNALELRDQVVAELKVQLKNTQDELYNQECIALSNSGPTWLNREPEDDNGDYARVLRV